MQGCSSFSHPHIPCNLNDFVLRILCSLLSLEENIPHYVTSRGYHFAPYIETLQGLLHAFPVDAYNLTRFNVRRQHRDFLVLTAQRSKGTASVHFRIVLLNIVILQYFLGGSFLCPLRQACSSRSKHCTIMLAFPRHSSKTPNKTTDFEEESKHIRITLQNNTK